MALAAVGAVDAAMMLLVGVRVISTAAKHPHVGSKAVNTSAAVTTIRKVTCTVRRKGDDFFAKPWLRGQRAAHPLLFARAWICR